MNTALLTTGLLKEMEAEAVATRKCLERIPEDKFDFKPHPSSMPMGYLALLVAEIPRWITVMVEEKVVDFATFKHAETKTTAALVEHFDENMRGAKNALEEATAEDLEQTFYLKNNGEELFSEKLGDYIAPTINHWVHHRGQLTVYMRLCEIPVPAIYGPSGDDKNY